VKELLDILPYLDIGIVALLLFFIYLGWSQGTPRLLMVIGAIYTGVLLASVYYHLFAVTLSGIFSIQSSFAADLISFLLLDVLVTIVMLALLFSLFGHVEIRNRMAVFDKIIGSVLGMLAGVLAIGILVTLLRVPYEASKQKLHSEANLPVVQLFNQAYGKSALSGIFVKGAPYFLASLKPMLPPQVQERGAVPLLESIVVMSGQ
jgi:uncharacterized membrane protein required for colicin V production